MKESADRRDPRRRADRGPARSAPSTITYPPTEVSEFDPATFELGKTEVEVAPEESVPMYDAARSVVDVMRLLELARALHVEGPVRQAESAVLS